MRKLIAAINMTLDGFCDHTAMIADDETHEHYNELLRNAGTLIYGRTTYQLMEDHWPAIVKKPTGNKATDDFAQLIDAIPKIVYSRTLKNVAWRSTTLKNELIRQEILDLKFSGKGEDNNIVVGSPGMIISLLKLKLVDECQFNIMPTVLGHGLSLFKDINERVNLKLLKTKTFNCGAVLCYYETGTGVPGKIS